MSRLDAGKVELDIQPFDMGQAVRNSLRRAEHSASEKSIEIETCIPDEVEFVGDRSAIEKSLSIVLRNAIKFTPNDGRIAVHLHAGSSGFNIFIADTGQGMSHEAIARLGKPFEQFHSQVDNGMKGSGLGLAIAGSLVHLHSGRLKVRSRLGRGTIVQFHLPYRPHSAAAHRAA